MKGSTNSRVVLKIRLGPDKFDLLTNRKVELKMTNRKVEDRDPALKKDDEQQGGGQGSSTQDDDEQKAGGQRSSTQGHFGSHSCEELNESRAILKIRLGPSKHPGWLLQNRPF